MLPHAGRTAMRTRCNVRGEGGGGDDAASAAPMITAQTRYAWEAGSREHDSHSKREMGKERKNVSCPRAPLEIIINISNTDKSSLFFSLRVWIYFQIARD